MSSTLRESKLEDQVDYNVDKILQILCKVLISEVTTDLAQKNDAKEETKEKAEPGSPIKPGEQYLTIQENTNVPSTAT